MSKLYEVEVKFVGTEWYAVRANSEEEAKAIYRQGDLTGTDGEEYEVVAVVEEFDQDDYDFDIEDDEDY